MIQHFDVAVLGHQIAGVIAAALLAKQGRRVILIDHGESITHYSHNGVRMPLVPQVMPAFESSKLMQSIHDQLGLTPDLRAATHKQEPSFQAVMPQQRLDIGADKDAILAELQLEFPEAVTSVEAFFSKLAELNQEIDQFLCNDPPLTPERNPLRTWLAQRKLAEHRHLDAPFEEHGFLSEIPPTHPVRELLLGPLSFFGHLSATAPSTLHAARLVGRYFSGTTNFVDSKNSLQNMLLEAAVRCGVEVRKRALIQEIQCKGSCISGLTLETESGPYTADFFIGNTQGGLADMVQSGRHQGRLALQEQAARPAASLLVLNFLVQRDVIPSGMGRALFLLNGRRHARDEHSADPPLLVERHAVQRRQGSTNQREVYHLDPDLEILSVACPVRTRDVMQSPERFNATKQAITSRLARLVPFLHEHIQDISLPVDTGNWDIEDEGAIRRVDPWRVYPLFETSARAVFGVASRSPHTAFKNLIHCGTDVFPGLGLEGTYLAGKVAAETAVRLAGKRWRKP